MHLKQFMCDIMCAQKKANFSLWLTDQAVPTPPHTVCDQAVPTLPHTVCDQAVPTLPHTVCDQEHGGAGKSESSMSSPLSQRPFRQQQALCAPLPVADPGGVAGQTTQFMFQ